MLLKRNMSASSLDEKDTSAVADVSDRKTNMQGCKIVCVYKHSNLDALMFFCPVFYTSSVQVNVWKETKFFNLLSSLANCKTVMDSHHTNQQIYS